MSLDVPLLRESFSLAATREPEVTALFYRILFARHPQVRTLFRHNAPEVQERMLRDALVSVLEHIEDARWLSGTLAALGEKHASYGVTPEMYGWVGASLLETLRTVLADEWTPAHHAAWSEAYGAVAALMQAGAR